MRTQKFSQKFLSASVAAVFALGAVSVATPAFANQFAAVVASGVSSPATLPAKATSNLNVAHSYVLSRSAGDTIAAGDTVIGLSGGATFRAVDVAADASWNVDASTARTITLAAGNGAAVAGTTTVKIGGVTFTVTMTSTTAGTVTNSANSTSTTITGDGTNDNYDIATALATNAQSVFSTNISDNGSGVITIATTAALTLTSSDRTAANATIGVPAGTSNAAYVVVDAANAAKSYINSSGALVVTSTAAVNGAAGVITLTKIALNLSSVAAGTTVKASVSSGPNGMATGATTEGNLVKVDASGVTASLATSTTPATVAGLGVQATLPNVLIAETFAGDLSATSATVPPIKVKLDGSLALNAGLSYSATSLVSGTSVQTLATNANATGTWSFKVMKKDGSVVTVTSAYTSGDTPSTQATALGSALTTAGVANTVSAGAVTITTGAGAFLDAGTASVATATTVTPSGTWAYGLSTDGILSIPVKTVSSAADTITITGLTTNVGAAQALGDYKANVTASVGSSILTSSVKVLTVAAGATNLEVNDGAPTGNAKPVFFAGRSATNPVDNNSGTATGDTIRLSESVKGTLSLGTLVTITLNAGTFSGTPSTVVTSGGVTLGAFTVSSDKKSATAAVTAISTASKSEGGYTTLSLGGVSLSSVTAAGDLSVSISGTGVTAQTVKLADIKVPSATTVAGTPVTVKSGDVITVPDITITESAAGALVNSGVAAVIANTTLDLSKATVKATKADGTDVSLQILGNASGVTPTGVASGTNAFFTILTASDSTFGPLTFKISGIKATIGAGASGTVDVVVGGATDNTDTSPTSAKGAQAIKSTTTIANVASSNPTYPTLSIADQTKAVIAGLVVTPGSADIGLEGSVFVAGFVPGVGTVFLDSKGAWSPLVAGKEPAAYANGILSSTTVDVIKTALDISSLKGTSLYIGYGVGSPAFGQSPFASMLSKNTYRLVYTVK